MALVRKRRSESTSGTRGDTARPEWAALSIFAALITLAPLAFGAVDRVVQAGLLVLFAAGLALRPPSVVRLSRRMNALLLTLVALLLLTQFAPAALFGGTLWRRQLVENFKIDLPWMHHPEPGRAVEGFLAAGVAAIWLLWVRTLAERRENRPWLAWSLAASAAVVAAVSFATRAHEGTAIYGLRFTEGWRGFGPFPNRNHTACFLAMGIVLSGGCTTWAVVRRKFIQAAIAAGLAILSLAALLATQSRGGLLALIAGLTLYGGLCLLRFRNRRTVAVAVSAALVIGAVALAGGSQLLGRFSSADGAVSNHTRVAIWSDTLRMWGDAPLFGHGISSFGSVFPLYERIQLDNQVILHPESSWLQWLAELGAIPVLLLAVVLGSFVLGHLPKALSSRRSFFLYAAGFAAFGTLLCHALIDVPAHRWATVAFGLAALGLASPRPRGASAREAEWNLHGATSIAFPRRAALAPLAVALFWLCPIIADWPASSTLTLQRVLAAVDEAKPVSAAKLDRELASFPLHPLLHQALGELKMREAAPEAEWSNQFRLANVLNPGSWRMPVYQAQLCGDRFPDLSIYFWQTAVSRAGVRANEIFENALRQTRNIPQAPIVWSSYINSHPALALEYAAKLPPDEAQPVFDFWWHERGLNPQVNLTPREAQVFYSLAPRYSSPDAFAGYLELRPARVSEDFLACGRLLHAWGEDDHAWQLLSTKLRDPVFPKARAGVLRADLERRLRVNPGDGAGAQALAATCMSEGDPDGARQVILDFARRPNAQPFFTRKAAYFLHADGHLSEAIEMLCREAG